MNCEDISCTLMKSISALFLIVFLSLPAIAQVRITEFMASNTSTLADEDGDFSDWIELQNTASNSVSLLNWALTDSSGNPGKWRFPATNMPPKSFLIVFASGKNRAMNGAPLHTNFKLGAVSFPTATRAMSYWTPKERRGFAQGITHAFSRLGNSLTPWLVALLILTYSWRASFIIIGIVSIIWALAWGLYFRDDPTKHSAVTSEEIASLPPYGSRKATDVKVPWRSEEN